MEVILLEKMKNLGTLGARVRVKPGYARNFLIPTGKAVVATASNLAAFEAKRAELERAGLDLFAKAQRRGDFILSLGPIIVRQRAGNEGRLFGSVGAANIANAITEAGVPINKSEVRLPNGPLRTVGEHPVELHLHTEVNTKIKISVVAEE